MTVPLIFFYLLWFISFHKSNIFFNISYFDWNRALWKFCGKFQFYFGTIIPIVKWFLVLSNFDCLFGKPLSLICSISIEKFIKVDILSLCTMPRTMLLHINPVDLFCHFNIVEKRINHIDSCRRYLYGYQLESTCDLVLYMNWTILLPFDSCLWQF